MRYEVTLDGKHNHQFAPNILMTEDQMKVAVLDLQLALVEASRDPYLPMIVDDSGSYEIATINVDRHPRRITFRVWVGRRVERHDIEVVEHD